MGNDNPYAVERDTVEAVNVGSVQVQESRAVSEVKAQVVMARQFPRDVVKATDLILAECDRKTLAERAIYSYPRGGTQIEGPSIRLAEAIGRAWGNLTAGVVEVERTEGESSMLAYAWDLETNTMNRREFKVAHVRDSKKSGKQIVEDERDIYEITANYGARRLRACILALIPGDVVDAAVERCKKTIKASIGDLPTALAKLLKAFENYGVTKAMIEKRLRHHFDVTQAAEAVQLLNIGNALRDGMGTVGDYFDVEGPAKSPETVVKNAEPSAAKRGPGRPPKDPRPGELDLTTPQPPEKSWKELLDFRTAKGLPAAALQDIEAALARKENDPATLHALLTKIKIAYYGTDPAPTA